MKKINFFAFLLLALSLSYSFFLQQVEDYRDKYVGRYFCNSNCQSLNQDQNGVKYNKDTATLQIVKDKSDSILIIRLHNNTHRVKVKGNYLIPEPISDRWRGRFFSMDSIIFTTTASRAPSTCGYKGVKLK